MSVRVRSLGQLHQLPSSPSIKSLRPNPLPPLLPPRQLSRPGAVPPTLEGPQLPTPAPWAQEVVGLRLLLLPTLLWKPPASMPHRPILIQPQLLTTRALPPLPRQWVLVRPSTQPAQAQCLLAQVALLVGTTPFPILMPRGAQAMILPSPTPLRWRAV
jgi:hypothetical protein